MANRINKEEIATLAEAIAAAAKSPLGKLDKIWTVIAKAAIKNNVDAVAKLEGFGTSYWKVNYASRAQQKVAKEEILQWAAAFETGAELENFAKWDFVQSEEDTLAELTRRASVVQFGATENLIKQVMFQMFYERKGTTVNEISDYDSFTHAEATYILAQFRGQVDNRRWGERRSMGAMTARW